MCGRPSLSSLMCPFANRGKSWTLVKMLLLLVSIPWFAREEVISKPIGVNDHRTVGVTEGTRPTNRNFSMALLLSRSTISNLAPQHEGLVPSSCWYEFRLGELATLLKNGNLRQRQNIKRLPNSLGLHLHLMALDYPYLHHPSSVFIDGFSHWTILNCAIVPVRHHAYVLQASSVERRGGSFGFQHFQHFFYLVNDWAECCRDPFISSSVASFP